MSSVSRPKTWDPAEVGFVKDKVESVARQFDDFRKSTTEMLEVTSSRITGIADGLQTLVQETKAKESDARVPPVFRQQIATVNENIGLLAKSFDEKHGKLRHDFQLLAKIAEDMSGQLAEARREVAQFRDDLASHTYVLDNFQTRLSEVEKIPAMVGRFREDFEETIKHIGHCNRSDHADHEKRLSELERLADFGADKPEPRIVDPLSKSLDLIHQLIGMNVELARIALKPRDNTPLPPRFDEMMADFRQASRPLDETK